MRSLSGDPDSKVDPIGHVLPWKVKGESTNPLNGLGRRFSRRYEVLVEDEKSDRQQNESLNDEREALSRYS